MSDCWSIHDCYVKLKNYRQWYRKMKDDEEVPRNVENPFYESASGCSSSDESEVISFNNSYENFSVNENTKSH